MKALATLCISAALFVTTPVIAGAGHDHDSDGGHSHSHGPVSSDTAVSTAAKKVKQLADAGKIDASWAGVKAAGAEKKTFSKGPEWVVTFKNDKSGDPEKQTLYIFLSLDGHYIAANYTGN